MLSPEEQRIDQFMNHTDLRKLRLALDVTQSEMAKLLLMSKSMYAFNERGVKPISARTAALAARLAEGSPSAG